MPKSRSKRRRRQPPPKANPKRSPLFVGPLIFTLLFTGIIIIIGNYAQMFEGVTSNWRLWYGLGLVATSFAVATQWH